jgi:hypothetical protein
MLVSFFQVTFDFGTIIELALGVGAVITIGFVIGEISGLYTTRSSQNAIMQTTATGVNAIVSMTTIAVAASQGMAVTEIAGVPTQIFLPKDKTTTTQTTTTPPATPSNPNPGSTTTHTETK